MIDYTNDLERNRVQGTATHALCGTEHCKVREQSTQATRTEPMSSLGLAGYCPTCEVSFKVEAVQELLAVDELQVSEQWTADGEHGFILWKNRVPYPIVYPTRDEAEAAAELVRTGTMFAVVA